MTTPDRLLWPQQAAQPATFPELPGTGATLRQVRVAAGHRAPRHSHPFEQFLYIVAGAGVIERESGPINLAPGTVLRFAPEDWHSADFTADTVLIEVNLAERPSVGV